MISTQTIAMLGAVALGALGVVLLVAPRRAGSWATRLRLAGVGVISTVTVLVAGLACLVVAYQLAVRALGVHTFRVPVWLAAGGAALAIALSLVTDAVESSRDARDE